MNKQTGQPVRGMWFEDFVIDAPMFTVGRTISESDINLFGGLTGDLYELHTNEEYARTTPFGGRIAQGMLGLALMHGLIRALRFRVANGNCALKRYVRSRSGA